MEALILNVADGHSMHFYRWLPDGEPLATVQIAHGMGEHAARYDWTAGHLTDAGFAVYAQDHRGHGTSSSPERYGDMGEDGWNRTISDAAELTGLIKNRIHYHDGNVNSIFSEFNTFIQVGYRNVIPFLIRQKSGKFRAPTSITKCFDYRQDLSFRLKLLLKIIEVVL